EEGPAKGRTSRGVMVDQSVKRLVISATVDPKPASLQLFDPAQTEIVPGRSPRVRFFPADNGLIVSIESPAPGRWRLVTEGQGQFSLWVRAASAFGLDSVEIWDVGSDRPVDFKAGDAAFENAMLRATVRLSAAAAQRVKFSLVSAEGVRLENAVT